MNNTEEEKENEEVEPSKANPENETTTTARKSNNNGGGGGKEKVNEEGQDQQQQEEKPLYFSKNGKPQFGITVPTAFAVAYPYPPLPSNLSKNRVLRPQSEQSKESLQEGIIEAEKDFEKEAMPLPGLTKVEGSPLRKVLIPEIELAIYWDRHAYELRPKDNKKAKAKNSGDNNDNGKHKNSRNSSSSIRRSKSEMNLSSQVGDILNEDKQNNSRRSSLLSAGKSSRSSLSNISTASSNKRNNHKTISQSNHHNHHNNFKDNLSDKGGDVVSENGSMNRSNSEKGSINTGSSISGKPGHNHNMQLSENEKRKFEDIKFSRERNSPREKAGESHYVDTRPQLRRTAEQARQMEALRKSTGIQVTLDDVAAAAMKSTYLCPLHGQYRRGVERRDRGGFRTDMSSVGNVHKNCSRALKGIPPRTKLIKSSETQTDEELHPVIVDQNHEMKSKRSKTAVHARNLNSKLKDIMSSEYHGSFRNPYKIAESEKRHLRNKILNYCFTKHSIF